MALPRSLSWPLVLWFAFFITAGARAADAPPKDRTCFVLDKIDTQADHDDPQSVSWKQGHSVKVNADGSITWARIGKGMRNEGCVFQAWPREGRATYTQGPGQAKGSGTMTWTPWPDSMCAGDSFPLSLRATAQGNATFGGLFNSWANQFDYKPITAANKDPMHGIFANNGEASGSQTVRLTPVNATDFLATVNLSDDGYAVEIHYHYRPLKPGEKLPPKIDPAGSCTKTFGKSWPSTDWGVIVFTLDGDKAAGSYTNRSGKFGAGTIAGTVAGNVLQGTWADASGKGGLKIVLSDDGCSFAGRFTLDGSGTSIGEPLTGKAHSPATTEGGGAIDLTGYWKSDTGAIYYLRQIGDKLYWGMDALPSARNVFTGTIAGTEITGTWVDLPGGAAETGTGTLKIKIDSNDKLTKISDSSPYGAGAWTRIAKPPGAGTGINGISGTGTGTPGTGGGGGAGTEPWRTPAGQACIERWTAEAAAKLNAYDGGKAFNDRKPWGIHPKYGTITNRGATSAFAPDGFPRYDNNKYWWIWDHYLTDAEGKWERAEWNNAGVPDLHAYVAKCAAK